MRGLRPRVGGVSGDRHGALSEIENLTLAKNLRVLSPWQRDCSKCLWLR